MRKDVANARRARVLPKVEQVFVWRKCRFDDPNRNPCEGEANKARFSLQLHLASLVGAVKRTRIARPLQPRDSDKIILKTKLVRATASEALPTDIGAQKLVLRDIQLAIC